MKEPRCIKPSAAIVTNELKGIKSFDLLFKAGNVFEKLIWGVVFLIGIFWASYFLLNEVQSWQGTHSVFTYQHMKLSEIESPAITICSQSSTKFAIAEQLGNYLNANHSLPDQFIKIREVLLKYLFGSTSGNVAPCPFSGCKVIYSFIS